jgi:hypothetical protein
MKYYKSRQVRQIMGPNGLKETVMDVEMKNGKGVKSVAITENGKTKKSTKKLTAKEMSNIQKNRFMPGFFNECFGECARSKQKTRKASKKKRV